MPTNVERGRVTQSAQKWKFLKKGKSHKGDNLPTVRHRGAAILPEKEDMLCSVALSCTPACPLSTVFDWRT